MKLAKANSQYFHIFNNRPIEFKNSTLSMAHLARLNIPIPMQRTDTKGLNRSPITDALRMIPLNPVLCGSMKLGQAALTYEAVQMKNNTTMIMLSKLKNAL